MNKIVVLSDIHIGNNTPTVWYQKSFHESYLVAALDWVKSNTESIQELILLGDVIDFWTYPAEEQPPSFDAIIAANPNIFGSNGKLSQVLTALKGKVTYVRGNHDMSITQADLNKIQNPNGYKIKLCPDDIYYPLGNANRRIACTHGHIYALFNAPYNNSSSPIAPLPVGHFVSRAVASKRKKELQPGQTVAELNDSGDPGMWEIIPRFGRILVEALAPVLGSNIGLPAVVAIVLSGRTARAWDALSSIAKLLLSNVSDVTGLGDTQPIKLPNGKQITIEEAKKIYDNLFSDWRNKNDFLTAYKALMADWRSWYMGWFAQKLAFEVGADLVVMGHTHTPISGLSNSLIQYINTGFNCPSVPDIGIGKKHPTFVTINVDNLCTDVLQVVKEGNSYNIKSGDAQRDIVAENDFSCYVIIDNSNGNSDLRRKDFQAKHGHYIVLPPEIIKRGETVRFWLQDYPGIYGAEGSVKYVKQDNQQEIRFTYGCPFVSSNYCSGTNFYTKSANLSWGNLNETKTSGHPFVVRFLNKVESRWELVRDGGKLLSVAEMKDGSFVGIGIDNQLYTLATLPSTWKLAKNGGKLLSVAILKDEIIVGVGTDNQLYTLDTSTSRWKLVGEGGKLLSVATMPNGTILGIGIDNQLYILESLTSTSKWKLVGEGGKLFSVSTIKDGIILGIGIDNQLYRSQML